MQELEITSVQNSLVKFCVKLQNSKFRKSNKLILVDGIKTIEGFIEDKIEFEYLFAEKTNAIYKNAKVKNLVFVNNEILKKISTTSSTSNVVGIISEPDVDEDLFYNLSKIVLIENIKDAGNLGTIIRSAAAFSMDGIILAGDCVDLYNPKVIRSTAQNIFKIPIVQIKNLDLVEKLVSKKHKLISTVVNSGKNIFNYVFPKENYIIAFGCEACGLSNQIQNIKSDKLTIPMENNVESINLGVCASVVFALIKKELKQ